MFVKNFYKWVDSHGRQASQTYKRCDGNNYTLNYSSTLIGTSFETPFKTMVKYTKVSTSGVNGYGYSGTRFGSGTTPPTGDDYCLENDVGDCLTVTTPSAISVTIKDTYVEYSATFGVTARETVTISEVGLFALSYIMIERTVLEKPIAIEAGQSKQITYTIRLNYPTG